MLKTVGKYETDDKVIIFKVRTKKEPAFVNIIDSSDNFCEEFSIVPVDSDLEICEEYVERKWEKSRKRSQEENSGVPGGSLTSQSSRGTAKGSAKAKGRRMQACEICGKHMRHRHVCNLKLYGCTCGVAFALKSEIEAHMREYEAEDTVHALQCRRCPALLNTAEDFDEHLVTEHKMFICLLCYKQFSTEDRLRHHLDSHATRQVIKCSVCSVELASRESLNRHMKCIHLFEAKITCSFCCTTFTTKDNLKRHVETVHEDRKDFVCTVCGKMFGQAATLQRHMATHSEHRPFKCAFCQESFKLPRDLRKHNSAHREYMLKCPTCDSYHLNQQELSLHLKRHPSHRKLSASPLAK